MNDRANIIVTNGTIIGGSVAFDEINRDLNSVTLRSVTIRNTANAAINLNTGSTKSQWLVMDKCKVENCGRIQVFSNTANIKVTNSTFTNNWSGLTGGAFYLPSINYPTFENCTFKGNKAMQGYGGAIDAKSVICKNCNGQRAPAVRSQQTHSSFTTAPSPATRPTIRRALFGAAAAKTTLRSSRDAPLTTTAPKTSAVRSGSI